MGEPPLARDAAQKVTFLFKEGRCQRVRDRSVGATEFFYGFVEMSDTGIPVAMVEEGEFGFGGRSPLPWTVISRLSMALVGIHPWAVYRFARGRDRFSQARTIVAVNNAYGIALAYLKARGHLDPTVTFIAMGLLEPNAPALVRWAYARILRHVTLATISRSEREHLASMLPGVTVHYIPFGVDHHFWTPSEEPSEDFVLAVGNDPHRDYGTLVEAWRPEFPKLRIVTRLPVPRHPANVEVLAGDWRKQHLSDSELRDLVRASRMVVIPVQDTLQPAGQSACLQAMACGKAVIMSDIEGLWDRDLMQNGKNCVLVPAGDPAVLARAVHGLLSDPGRVHELGRAARRTVEENLNVDIMANALGALCLKADERKVNA